MKLQHSIPHRLTDFADGGGWWVFARPKNQPVADITFLRGVPVLAGDFSFSDPYGPKDMTLVFPQISIFDKLGYGDLYWLRKKVSIDVIWAGPDLGIPLPAAYPFGNAGGSQAFVWEGYITGFAYGDQGLSCSLKGEMYQQDDYYAKPEYLERPITYEAAIARQFGGKPHLRMASMQVRWPSWWTTVYTPPKKGTPRYLIPAGVTKGDKWTGLLTRSTGQWEPVLSSYIQTLLNAMYTRRGRWTLDLFAGRVPVLLHRDMLTEPDNSTVVVDAVSSTVNITKLEVDWSQALDVAYGQGVSLAGVAYSGMIISADGSRTTYQPLASMRYAYPDEDNDWLDLSEMPKEVLLQMQPGLSEYDASKVALAHLERFGDPGVTGEVVLSGDVKLGSGDTIPHHLVRAGMTMQLRNIMGIPEGVLTHITDSSTSIDKGTTSCQVDSKYRDALTVEEVRTRGRDAMQISRMLVAGQYEPPLPDQILPWNYAEGSGMIPSHPGHSALELFQGMPDNVQFPWTKWTTAHPPKSGRWKNCYIEIPPASANADKNWSGLPRKHGGKFGIGVKMAQAGSIRLIQIAAYDRNGNVMKVPFHVSFYYMSGVNYRSMPKIPAYDPVFYPYHHPPFAVGQHYPYVVNAFEQYNLDGTEKGIEVPMPVQTAGLWKAFGNDKVKAGYWPGDGYSGDPTGLMVDETVQSFNTSSYGGFNVYTRKQRTGLLDAGWMYVMIYCDAQATQPVYFLGRMFRVEPGTQGGGG